MLDLEDQTEDITLVGNTSFSKNNECTGCLKNRCEYFYLKILFVLFNPNPGSEPLQYKSTI